MLVTEKDVMLQRELQNDIQRAAERQRLVQEALSTRKRPTPFYVRAFGWLRSLWINLTCRLQTYRELAASTTKGDAHTERRSA